MHQLHLSRDIIRLGIPHSCQHCIHNESCDSGCHGTPNPQCYKFMPDSMDRFLNDTITYCEINVPKSKERLLKRVCTYNRCSNDNVTTLDEYYVSFINDSIKELRKGKTVYVFQLRQMWEILRFVDNLNATYVGDGIIALSCKTEDSKDSKNSKSKLEK